MPADGFGVVEIAADHRTVAQQQRRGGVVGIGAPGRRDDPGLRGEAAFGIVGILDESARLMRDDPGRIPNVARTGGAARPWRSS
ncbi:MULTISPECIES: hypothetical protein [unclassified Streptomyces]|uniref:hypothetical protein n=1 Tax=unclassified Streptomyces TaxID=2593676 RepID=UPI00114CA149|nr:MULTISPECIES: hypothetical protein [unclassified Streptomyces]MYZ34479.1 hypothetical protein [Streptomyces sp. SID4917]